MTPAQVEVARQLVALPGGWRWLVGMTVIPVGYERERWLLCWTEHGYTRRPDGTWPDEPDRWIGGGYQTSGGKWWGIAGSEEPIDLGDGWLPDLTDDSTGGVLLGMLPPGWCCGQTEPDGRYYVVPIAGGPFAMRAHHGSTLAEAAARALVALGRCA